MTPALFILAAVLAVAATLLAVTRRQAVHALLYLVVSFLALAVVFFLLGSALAALLEIMVYAGAIMVLFLFVVMTIGAGRERSPDSAPLFTPGTMAGPATICALLFGEWLLVMLGHGSGAMLRPDPLTVHAVGAALFGEYALGVELASLLLLAALVGAFQLGRKAGETPMGGGAR
jgi:NADH-quinone oxidoreductase subunit J